MIISRGRGYVFVHIPKTGGTSMALALEARAKKDDILIGDTPKAVRRRKRLEALPTSGRLWKHARLTDIDQILTPEEVKEMFVFTLVRNPWDRMVSYYAWLREQSFDHLAVTLAKKYPFSEFLARPETAQVMLAERFGDYVTDKDGFERCDAFVRLEHLDEDLPKVEARLGIPLAPLPHENRSDRPADYRNAYSKADALRLAHLCAADINRFGYSF